MFDLPIFKRLSEILPEIVLCIFNTIGCVLLSGTKDANHVVLSLLAIISFMVFLYLSDEIYEN